jgi:DNA gyrase inhibitor GyrI
MISTDKLVFAYRYMFEQWLPNSKYEGDDSWYNLEFNKNNPREDQGRKAKVDLYVPIIEKRG